MNSPFAENSAAQLAQAVAQNVPYQGRKTIRRRSEVRRQAILDASLRIIVRDGVRAVRHRAVAAEAGVPLSATTYYFKDINDLISDSFALHVERSATRQAAFWQRAQQALRVAPGLGEAARRESLLEQVGALLDGYLLEQLQQHRQALLVDQAFRQEALRNPLLAQLLRQQRQILQNGLAQLLALLGSQQPQQDAGLLTAVIAQMEYRGLLDGAEQRDRQQLPALLRRHLQPGPARACA